jgi:phosphofructokinase-like protein
MAITTDMAGHAIARREPAWAGRRRYGPGHGIGDLEDAMRVGMLTGGGDCPGLNAVMRAVVRRGSGGWGDEFVGFLDGWRGFLDDQVIVVDVTTMRGTLPKGGTILGSSRTNPYKVEGGVERCLATVEARGLDALIAIGGEDTLGVAAKLTGEGIPIVGVPKTIDNDLSATELTFGFDTAVQICVDAIDRLHTTAESHDRVMVVEVMGRHAGHIAVWSGIAGGAAATLIPEVPFDIDDLCNALLARHDNGRYASIVVAAEGAVPKEGTLAVQSGDLDQFGHAQLGGVGDLLAREIQQRTGFETRCTVLGHVQRGGTPSAFDRVLATRFGVGAIEAVHDRAWGHMVALQAGEIVRVPLADAVGSLKLVDPALYAVAKVFE